MDLLTTIGYCKVYKCMVILSRMDTSSMRAIIHCWNWHQTPSIYIYLYLICIFIWTIMVLYNGIILRFILQFILQIYTMVSCKYKWNEIMRIVSSCLTSLYVAVFLGSIGSKVVFNYTDILVVFNILMIFDIDSLNFWDLFEQLCAAWILVFVQKSWT